MIDAVLAPGEVDRRNGWGGSVVVDGLDHALLVAQRLIDADQRQLASLPLGAQVSCRAGCTTCCLQAVSVGPAELRALVAAIRALPIDHQVRIAKRLLDAGERLRNAGFTADSLHDANSDEERFAIARRYFAQQIPCPLLEGGQCSVRAARPLTCREYLVVSDPALCGTLGEAKIVRIRSKRAVLENFSALEQRDGEGHRRLLALALSERIPEAGDALLDPAVVLYRLSRVTR